MSPRGPGKGRTADALMEMLNRDPAYRERMAAKEAERVAGVAAFERDVAPILEELSRSGIHVENLPTLLKEELSLARAVPILLSWLPKVSNRTVKEALVRTVSVPAARPVAALPLITEFRKSDDLLLRWTIGNALDIVADDSVAVEIIPLALDRSLGKAREMVVKSLGNMNVERVLPVLIELLGDDEVCGYALMAISKLGAAAALPHVRPLLKHRKPWVRKEAKRVLARMEEKRER